MKKNIYMLAGLMSILALSSCIKQIDKTFQGQTVVEIDPTVLNSANATAGYPVLTRIPAEGIPLRTADSTLRRLNGIIRVRVNLVGPQSDQAQTIGYKVLTASPITSVSFPATATGQARFLGIQLDSSGTLKPNPNYNKIGLAIDQR